MKTFSTSGTGSQQTLSEIESDKMPIYDSLTDVEADLANLEEGQIVATKDTGSELSQPVDAVEEGNMHAVTSNAVAGLYANTLHIENKTKAFTIGANDDSIIYITLDAISGYKPIIISGISFEQINNNNAVVIQSFYLDITNMTVNVLLGNRSSSMQLTGTLKVQVIYAKDSFVD